ncbi:MAG: hypothetical protein Q8P81_01570 [Nanoarchaeota archaeon]|nr:hypothetical protein [Nanoarchaeota archaeon]
MLKKNKRGIQVSFAWIFAIIAGVFIIFLAIYGTTKVVDTGGRVTSAKASKEIGVLLNPLETGFGESATNLLTMPVETRIHNRCSSSGNFGAQTIQISQKSFGKWSPTGLGSNFENKYLFSEGEVEGKDFFLFSKSFNFPFKVADLIYVTSARENYCFVNPPEDISQELSDLNQENIFTESCPTGSIRVCFDSLQDNLGQCDVEVRTNRKEVEKKLLDPAGGTRVGGEVVYFETDALMYAAIFSNHDIYECQVQRLMKRTDAILTLYDGKNDLISGQGCEDEVDLLSFKNSAGNFLSSEDIFQLASEADSIKKENDRARCQLW